MKEASKKRTHVVLSFLYEMSRTEAESKLGVACGWTRGEVGGNGKGHLMPTGLLFWCDENTQNVIVVLVTQAC